MIWTRTRDKYGRSVHELRNSKMRTQGVVVRLPKVAIESGRKPYLVNEWANDYRVTEHATLKAAKAYLEAAI